MVRIAAIVLAGLLAAAGSARGAPGEAIVVVPLVKAADESARPVAAAAVDAVERAVAKRPGLAPAALDRYFGVDEPGWGVRQPWEHWLKIEQLAADTEILLDCCAAFQADRARVLHPVDRQWRYEVERWLDL